MKFNEFIAQVALPKVQNLGSSMGNSYHKDWPDVAAANVTDWEEFNEQTFEYLYGYLWKSSVDCSSLKKPPKQMTYVTGEDSIEKLLAAVFQFSIGHLFENLKSMLGREIWLGAGSLCNLGSNVLAQYSGIVHSLLCPRFPYRTHQIGLVQPFKTIA
jgi:hypothetical protein